MGFQLSIEHAYLIILRSRICDLSRIMSYLHIVSLVLHTWILINNYVDNTHMYMYVIKLYHNIPLQFRIKAVVTFFYTRLPITIFMHSYQLHNISKYIYLHNIIICIIKFILQSYKLFFKMIISDDALIIITYYKTAPISHKRKKMFLP